MEFLGPKSIQSMMITPMAIISLLISPKHKICISIVGTKFCVRDRGGGGVVESFSDIDNIVGSDRAFDSIRIFHVTRYGTLNFLSDTKISITVQTMLIDLIDKSKFAGNNVKFNSWHTAISTTHMTFRHSSDRSRKLS